MRSATITRPTGNGVPKRDLHINVFELKGAFLGIRSLLKKPTFEDCVPNMDNSKAVAHINHMGGTHFPELQDLTLELWNWCIRNDLFIIAHHVPGKTNLLPDHESKQFPGQMRLDDKPDNYSAFSEQLSNRPLRSPANTATTGLHQLEAGSRRSPLRCIHHELEGSCRICIPTVQPCFQGPEQSNVEQNRDRSSSSDMASPTVVASPKVTGETTSSPSEQEPTSDRPNIPSTNSSDAPPPPSGRVLYLQ